MLINAGCPFMFAALLPQFSDSLFFVQCLSVPSVMRFAWMRDCRQYNQQQNAPGSDGLLIRASREGEEVKR